MHSPGAARRTPAPAPDAARTAFDFDGVLADTMSLFVELAREDYGLKALKYTDITCYRLEDCLTGVPPGVIGEIFERILEGRAGRPLRPLAGAAAGVRRQVARFGRLLCVTARRDPRPVRRWIAEEAGVAPSVLEIVATGSHEDKAAVLVSQGVQWFVEDRLSTCLRLDAAGIRPLLFRQPWNRRPHPFVEVGDWRHLGDLLHGSAAA